MGQDLLKQEEIKGSLGGRYCQAGLHPDAQVHLPPLFQLACDLAGAGKAKNTDIMTTLITGIKQLNEVLEENASILDPDGNGDKYFFLPFWFEKLNSYGYKMHSLDNLPPELKEELNNQRTGF